jgi:molecular chaperone Hsp33
VTAALISLGKKELTEIMAEGKDFPVECQFCDEQYLFTSEDIKALLSQLEEA